MAYRRPIFRWDRVRPCRLQRSAALDTIPPTLADRSESVLEVTPLPDGDGFALAGTLDLGTAEDARRSIEPAWRPGAEITLDLTRLEFMDSTGLNLIVETLRALGDDGRLVVRVPRGIVRRILRVSGLERRPNLTVSREEPS